MNGIGFLIRIMTKAAAFLCSPSVRIQKLPVYKPEEGPPLNPAMLTL